MSLFQTKEFWSTQCVDDEEFDQNSIVVSKLNADSDHIIIGSHSGVLRIYKPNSFTPGSSNNYKPNDLLVEKSLDAAILQVAVGKFVSGSYQSQIAILHPRSVAVYSLVAKDGIAEHGAQYILNLLYEHKLRRTAANFTVGPFGGAQNRDFMCVQSLDGLLSFYEQEIFNFCCFLPDFLLPGCLVYVKSIDSFITACSSWELQVFSYKDLSEIGHTMNQDDSSGKKVINKIWSFNLGEGIVDIQSLYEDGCRQNFVAVLGERNLYYFHDNGKLRFMKKLEYMPVCFYFYYLTDGTPMLLVVSDNNTMLVYQNTTVKWSAKLLFQPTAVTRATYTHIVGALVLLSDAGYIQICYLGTEPNIFSAPPLRNQELNFDEAERELETLNKIIKSHSTADVNIANAIAEKDLLVTITTQPHLEELPDEENGIHGQKSCKITIEVVPHSIFEEVHISTFTQKPIVVSPKAFFLRNLINTTQVTCYGYLSKTLPIPSLDLDVTISSITSLGVPRVVQQRISLPIGLIMETSPPVKEGEYKITVNINENPVPLSELFPEYIGQNLTTNSSAIGFKLIDTDGPIVTILTAKSSQRYRLQCDDFPSINIMTQEVTKRLNKYYMKKEAFKVSYSSNLPTNEVIKYICDHFKISQRINKLEKELNLLSAQFRLIQKRLIMKFKQKNPTPLSNLDILLQDTYKDLSNVMTDLENERCELEDSQIRLSSVLDLICTLLKLMDTDKDVDGVVAALCTSVYDIENQNWEDVVDASLCYLLRTTLAKSEKDKLRAPHTSFEEIKDISKLEKHFTQVLERCAKKGSSVEKQPPVEVVEEEKENPTQQQPAELEVGEIGTEIAKSSSRILSARKNLLSRRQKVDE